MSKSFLEYLSVIMTDTCVTCHGHGDRCICYTEIEQQEQLTPQKSHVKSHDTYEFDPDDREDKEEDRLIRCEGCCEYACICGEYESES
jgi:hypothetical protein